MRTQTSSLHRPAPLRALTVALVAALLAGLSAAPGSARNLESVVVQGVRGVEQAVAAVRGHGGSVEQPLELIRGAVAEVPAHRVDDLARDPRVAGVTDDATYRVQGADYADGPPSAYVETVAGDAASTGGLTGDGVGVALLDTGVTLHPDLGDRVVATADLTDEGTYTDSFGHGTFLGGLIAGDGTLSDGRYRGVAPDAHLVSVKVAGADGETTLGQVLYGLQLIDYSKDRYDVDVVVVALAGPARPGLDPLQVALERLWADGLVVVTAAGNEGPGSETVTSPGSDPYVVTAGAVDDRGTADTADDTVPDWSSRGPTVNGFAKPDLVAPGSSLVSLRAPDSTADTEHPDARVGDGYFKGTGTSMSTAVTAGAAALLLEAHPALTPDEVKGRLTGGAAPAPAGAGPDAVGHGRLDVAGALDAPTVSANQDLPRLEGGAVPAPTVRGGTPELAWTPTDDGPDVWVARSWAARSWAGRSWAARSWADVDWSARSWAGRSWAGRSWAGRSWAGRSWAGRSWAGRSWTGRSWTGRSWTGRSWSAVGWG